MSTYIDGLLVDWEAAFFNQEAPSRAGRSKRGVTGVLPKRPKASPTGSGLSRDPRVIRAQLDGIARKSPQVLVKITPGVPKGMRHIRRHLDYITRQGELELEDQDGHIHCGEQALADVADDWKYSGIVVPEDGDIREAFNLVFSMPTGTDPIAVKRAVRDFAAREFAGHQYAMVLHTYDTDPDPEPSRYPHVHLAVKARADDDATRLNPRKGDLQRWRDGFAQELRDRGIDAASTRRELRLQRKRGDKQAVRGMRKRGVEPERIGRTGASDERVQRARRMQGRVLGGYKEVVTGLIKSEDRRDRQLAAGIMASIRDAMLPYQQQRAAERGRVVGRADGDERPPPGSTRTGRGR